SPVTAPYPEDDLRPRRGVPSWVWWAAVGVVFLGVAPGIFLFTRGPSMEDVALEGRRTLESTGWLVEHSDVGPGGYYSVAARKDGCKALCTSYGGTPRRVLIGDGNFNVTVEFKKGKAKTTATKKGGGGTSTLSDQDRQRFERLAAEMA